MIGFVGDVHGDYAGLRSRMNRFPNIKEWVQVGDLGGKDISYEDFPSHLSFISGNHENWNDIEKMHTHNWPDHVLHIENGGWARIEGLEILGLGGNYSPKFYEYPADKLQQERRRHFVKEQVEELIDIARDTNIDILLTHEAPSPYMKEWGGSNRDMGIEVITELIQEIKPKIHFFGHHHKMTINRIGDTLSVGLGRSDQEFFILAPDSMELSYIDLDSKIIEVPL
jgi:Icc-related predicted phosphoesterase